MYLFTNGHLNCIRNSYASIEFMLANMDFQVIDLIHFYANHMQLRYIEGKSKLSSFKGFFNSKIIKLKLCQTNNYVLLECREKRKHCYSIISYQIGHF